MFSIARGAADPPLQPQSFWNQNAIEQIEERLHEQREDRGRTRRDGKAGNKREFDRCGRGRDNARTRNGAGESVGGSAAPRAMLNKCGSAATFNIEQGTARPT